MSEYGASAGPYRSQFLVDRKLETVKKGFWQSSLGFGGLGDIPQSRRHSFADVPTRQGSISSIGEAASQDSGAQDSPHGQEFSSPYTDMSSFAGSSQGELLRELIRVSNSSETKLPIPPVPSYFTGGAASQQALQHAAMGRRRSVGGKGGVERVWRRVLRPICRLLESLLRGSATCEI